MKESERDKNKIMTFLFLPFDFHSSHHLVVEWYIMTGWHGCKSLLVLLSGMTVIQIKLFLLLVNGIWALYFLCTSSVMSWHMHHLHAACLCKWRPESAIFTLEELLYPHQSCRTEEWAAITHQPDITLSLLWMEEKEPLSKACPPNEDHPWDWYEVYLSTFLFVWRRTGYGLP